MFLVFVVSVGGVFKSDFRPLVENDLFVVARHVSATRPNEVHEQIRRASDELQFIFTKHSARNDTPCTELKSKCRHLSHSENVL